MPAEIHCPNCLSENVIFSKKRGVHVCEDCGHEFTPEKPFVPQRIFLSYGHDEHVSLAIHLRDDMRARKHTVWFDEERLQPGHDWEAFIENGLEHLAADKANAAVILLLTPHSVRRPDGYCLNEVARALSRGLRIIPLMVVESEPPLSICRIQWLDMRQCLPIHEKEAFYRLRFERLLKALEENQLDFEGTQQRLLKALQPLEFDADILRHLTKFTGRQWVFDAIDQWLAETPPKQRVFWISGGPGVGKTAISAMLSSRYLEVAALHLCKYGHAQKSDPRSVVTSVVYQLTTQLPEYEARLASMDVEKLALDDARTMFDNLLVQPLAKLTPPKRSIVILIDALDEATRDGRNELASFIAVEFPKTPAWLRLIITCRPETEVTAPLQGLNPFILDTDIESNRADIRDYLRCELASHLQYRPDAEHLIEQIVAKSEGLFLYIERVCDDIQHGNLSLDYLDQFPQGLGGVYWQYFERKFPDHAHFKKEIRPALRAILAAREPLPVEILQRLFNWQEEEIRDFTRPLASLFPVMTVCGHDVIKPYHKSLVDWLSNADKAGCYFASLAEGQCLLTDEMWRQYLHDPGDMSSYALRNIVSHLAATKRVDNLCMLLCDLRFVAARCTAGLVPELQMDYNIALDVVAKFQSDSTTKSIAASTFTMTGQHHSLEAVSEYGSSSSHMKLVLEEYSRAFTLRSHLLSREPGEVLSQIMAAMAESLPATHPAKAKIRENTEGIAYVVWLRQDNWLHRNQNSALVRLIDQHRAAVLALAFSPIGEKVASGDAGGSILIWDINSGVVDFAMTAEAGPICAMSFSPDGKLLYCACSPIGVLVLDINKKELSVAFKHAGVSSLVLCDNGSLLIVADTSGRMIWLSTKSMKAECEIGNSLSNPVHCLACFPDGMHFVTGGEDGTVQLWDGLNRIMLRDYGRHRDRVVSVAVSSDGTRIASGSRDRAIMLWDARSGKNVGSMEGHLSIVAALSFTNCGKELISGSYDRTIRLWDVSSGLLRGVVAGHDGWVRSLALSPSGDRVVSGSEDGMVKVWSESLYDGSHAQHGHSHWVLRSCITKNERRMISVSRDSTICIWDLQDESVPPIVLQGHKGWIHAVATMQHESEICTCGNDMKVLVWNIDHPETSRLLFKHSAMARAVTAGDGWIAVGGVGSSISVWRTGFSSVRRMEIHAPRITDMAVTSDGQQLLVRCSDRSVRLIDTMDVCEMRCFPSVSGEVECEMDRRYSQSVVGCSADSTLVFAGSAEGRISVWDIVTGKLVFEQNAHRGGLRAACILPGQTCIATGGEDYAVRVWDLTSGSLVTTFHATAPPSSLTWLHNSNQLCLIESSIPRPRVRLFTLCAAQALVQTETGTF